MTLKATQISDLVTQVVALSSLDVVFINRENQFELSVVCFLSCLRPIAIVSLIDQLPRWISVSDYSLLLLTLKK